MSTGREVPATPLPTSGPSPHPSLPTPRAPEAGSARPMGRRPPPSRLRSLREVLEDVCPEFPTEGGRELTPAVLLASRVQEGVLQIKGAWAPGWPEALPWRMSPDLAMLTGLLPSGWPACFPGTWSGLARVAASLPLPGSTLLLLGTLLQWPPCFGHLCPRVALPPLLPQPRSSLVYQAFRPSWPLPARDSKMLRGAQ